MVIRFAQNLGRKSVVYIPVSVCALVLVYMGCVSVMQVGHYSFLLAIWLMITALLVPQILHVQQRNIGYSQIVKVCERFSIVALVIAASMSWRAITPVGLSVSIYFMVISIYENRSKLKQGFKASPLVAFPTIGLVCAGVYSLNSFLGGDLRNGLNLKVLTNILTIEGGTATVSPMVLSILLLIAWFPFLTLKNNINSQFGSPGTVLQLSMVGVFVVMMFISYVTEGHGIYYAVHKYELLLAICMFPLAMMAIVWISSPEKFQWTSLGFVLILLAVFFYGGSLSDGLSYPGVYRSEKAVWANVAENELREYPDKRVVCLNTSDPDKMYADYVAYTCNRILVGLQGLEGNDDYEDWTRLGMWLTDTSRLESLPSSYYESITFIVFDPEFSRTGDEIVLRAINSIQWDKARAVDLDGNLVSVPSAS